MIIIFLIIFLIFLGSFSFSFSSRTQNLVFVMEDCAESIEVSQISGYRLLFKALTVIPISHYVIGLYCVFLVFLYNFLELHFFEDLFSGGSVVNLTYHSGSELYQSVVSKCKILHTRYDLLLVNHIVYVFVCLCVCGHCPVGLFQNDVPEAF